MDKGTVIEELRRVARSLEKDSVTRKDFARHGAFSPGVVERAFGSWNSAIEAAGLVANTQYLRIDDAELEDEFRRVKGKLSRVPSKAEFRIHGNISPEAYKRRFGQWAVAVGHYTYGKGDPAVPVEQVNAAAARDSSLSPGPGGPAVIGRRAAYQPRLAFGSPIDFRGLRHEPLDEQGVVFLFGMVARDLGFLVEAVRQSFPDCIAKRAIRVSGRDLYEPVRIEFEYRSSAFKQHGHDPEQCDLIVCWQHDWADCPLEVVELKSEIAKAS